jgi:hypothetical protein
MARRCCSFSSNLKVWAYLDEMGRSRYQVGWTLQYIVSIACRHGVGAQQLCMNFWLTDPSLSFLFASSPAPSLGKAHRLWASRNEYKQPINESPTWDECEMRSVPSQVQRRFMFAKHDVFDMGLAASVSQDCFIAILNPHFIIYLLRNSDLFLPWLYTTDWYSPFSEIFYPKSHRVSNLRPSGL